MMETLETYKSFVLIVDDIESNIEFLSDIISSLEQVETIGLSNGQETLDLVAKRKPDLILLDVSMPKMDGYEVCRILKSNPDYAEIPIIFITARVQKEDIIRGFEVGALDYIAKPFNLNELLSRVKTHLELRHKTKQLRDINQQLEEKVLERTRQLSESNRKLTEANRELATLDRAKNDFITHINHELRTPLNGIVGYTSLLAENVSNTDTKNYLKSINTLVLRLIKLAEISLLFTELRTVDHKIKLEKVNLSDIVHRNIDSKEIAEKELEIEIEKIDNSIFLSGESRLLSACIAIVIDNAIKYSPRKGKITIMADSHNDIINLTIQDEGPGFSKIALSKLFELFTADNLDQRSHGFGIGLATAKHIIDLIGGDITIQSSGQKGATVVLHLKKA